MNGAALPTRPQFALQFAPQFAIAVALWIAPAAARAQERLLLDVAPRHVRVGDHVAVKIEADEAPAGESAELRFAEAPRFDATLALVERRLLPAGEGRRRAAMELDLVACAPGKVELGPFELALHGRDGSVRTLSTDSATVEVIAPWSGDEPPPFGEWRQPAPRSEGWRIAGLAALVLALVGAGAWLARRRRRAVAPPVASARGVASPTLAQWRALLLAPIDAQLEARRRWCVAVHALLRRELAARARAADFAWSREELVGSSGFGVWPARSAERWSPLLQELERGMFARAGSADPAARIGAPLFELLQELPLIGADGSVAP